MVKLFRSLKEGVKGYLTFNYAERRGIMVLIVLILLTESVNALLPVLVKEESCDMSQFKEEIKAFEAALNAPDTLKKYETRKTKYEKRSAKYEKEQFPKQSSYTKKAFAERPPLMIEINTADSALLVRLYGIGPSFARRILKYRGMLGGFFSTEQLLEVYGMDSSRYNGILENIHVDTSQISKIPVNEADFKTLLQHPYLDYETVKLIVNYRDHVGPITCSDTLRKVIAYDPMWEAFRRYANYKIDTSNIVSDSTGVISTEGRNL
ncbi:MAG: helix-hairpin-helix domain-containing protein [Bacteroidales bacterium]|jgi:DNA uptake protein ComE-like DNA-binding protein|nr:helix-hairpin-helix domain-containing protein [Bacteroidales bacterium]